MNLLTRLIKSFSIILLIIFFSSCHNKSQMVVISPDVSNVFFNKKYNKTLNFKVIDDRDNKEFIGFKAPVAIWKFDDKYKNPNYFSTQNKVARLNNQQNLVFLVKKSIANALYKKGIGLKRFTINQLSVEIVELSFIHTVYRSAAYSKIRVKVSNKNDDLEKIYEKKMVSYKPMIGAIILGPFNISLSKAYYNRLISDSLNQNIQSVINDDQLWKFLD